MCKYAYIVALRSCLKILNLTFSHKKHHMNKWLYFLSFNHYSIRLHIVDIRVTHLNTIFSLSLEQTTKFYVD